MLIAMFVVSFLFELLLPFVVGFFLWKKFGAKWKLFFIGVASFLVSQIIHLPMVFGYQSLLTWQGLTDAADLSMRFHFLNALAYGLMAGVCEEVVRWFAFKLAKDDGETSRSALMLGIGHGGLESVLVGLSVLSATVTVILFMNGALPVDQLPAAQLAQLEELVSGVWYLPLLGAFERLAAVTLHISLAMIIWLGIRDKKVGFLFVAIAWHAFVDFLAVFALQGLGWSVFAIEGVMLIVALLSAVLIFLIVKKHGLLTLYAPEKLDDEEEFSGLFADQFREAGFSELENNLETSKEDAENA